MRVNFSSKFCSDPTALDKEKALTWVRMMVYTESAPEMAADCAEREADELYAKMTPAEQKAADATYIRYCLNRMSSSDH